MDAFWWTMIIDFLVLLAALFVIFVFLLPVALGAPYVPITREKLDVLINMAKIRPGERAVDLGSGDGRIVIALARAGAEAHGYEINPLLVWISRRNVRRAGLKGKAFIHWKSFRQADFKRFDVVTIYGFNNIMKELEARLQKDLPLGGRVVSHTFKFPNWQPKESGRGVYLYIRPLVSGANS